MRAVLFDLFETLISYRDPDWKPPLRSTAERLGIAADAYAAHWGRIERAWETGAHSSFAHALQALYDAAGVAADARAIAELERGYVAYAARTAFLPADRSIVAMLNAVRSAGLRLAVVTNANDLDTAPWSRHELAPLIDVFVASHQVGLRKPDPRIYRLACERLDVALDQAVFVGDGGSDELAGARDAGIAPLWCTWFLDLWPEGVRPNGFPGDVWRQRPAQHPAPFPRLARPDDLLAALGVR